MTTKIARIILFVKDVNRSAEFYRDIIGLKIIGKIDKEWTELKAGGCNIALHKTGKSGVKKGDSGVKIVFAAKNVKSSKAELEKNGCPMGKIITFGEMSFCDGYDPDGNRFQFSDR